MSDFLIVHESTEDTLGEFDDLQTAFEVARELAQNGPIGDLVSVLESSGKAVRQFVQSEDGTVIEQPIARPIH
mgnify:CR=1 FL=1